MQPSHSHPVKFLLHARTITLHEVSSLHGIGVLATCKKPFTESFVDVQRMIFIVGVVGQALGSTLSGIGVNSVLWTIDAAQRFSLKLSPSRLRYAMAPFVLCRIRFRQAQCVRLR